MLSEAAQAVLRIAKEAFDDDSGNGTKQQVLYEMDFRDPRNGNVMSTLQFKLGKPISEEQADKIIDEMFPLISTVLGEKLVANVGANLLAKQGIVTKKIREDIDSSFEATFISEPTDSAEEGSKGAVRTAAGRFTSLVNLKASLELLMKENMLKTMTSPLAGTGTNSPLKYRTGRLLNSSEVVSVALPTSPNGAMSIYYKYMVYPYQVFDPNNTESPHMGLASRMRNPQKLIGDALQSAARRLLSSRYKVIIRQIY
jgi:hypothetical protein